jgi:hypothetical protein
MIIHSILLRSFGLQHHGNKEPLRRSLGVVISRRSLDELQPIFRSLVLLAMRVHCQFGPIASPELETIFGIQVHGPQTVGLVVCGDAGHVDS